MNQKQWSAQDKANRIAHESLAFYRTCVAKDNTTREETEVKQSNHWDAQQKSNLMAHESLAFYRTCIAKDTSKK